MNALACSGRRSSPRSSRFVRAKRTTIRAPTGALETFTKPIEAALYRRRYGMKNRERLNRRLCCCNSTPTGGRRAWLREGHPRLASASRRPARPARRVIADPSGARRYAIPVLASPPPARDARPAQATTSVPRRGTISRNRRSKSQREKRRGEGRQTPRSPYLTPAAARWLLRPMRDALFRNATDTSIS